MFVCFKFRSNQFFQNLNIIPLLLALLLFLILPNKGYTQEDTISSIIIVGNQRITSDTILSISKIEKGLSYNPSQLNTALQLIKKSTYFSNVTFSVENNTLKIKVTENPTINSINFEGNNILQDINLSEMIYSKERQSLSISKAEKDSNVIASAYSDLGRISATVSPKIVKLSDNRVDLVFEISEGFVTEVEKIIFTGNRNFSDLRLKGIIATKQAGIFRHLIKSDTYVEEKLDYDISLLQNFYINKGYIDFAVTSSVDLTRSKDAFLIKYTIKEGQRYSFNKINFNLSNFDINMKSLTKLNKIKDGSTYDRRRIIASSRRKKEKSL